jgi:hypothetical protein
MSLQARRPPGHAKRKALTYAADIIGLRVQGHSFSAIREALEDAGVLVSISTVRREVLRAAPATAVRKPAPAHPSPYVGPANRDEVGNPVSVTEPASVATSLPGRAIAEEFMRGRPTNTLFLKEPTK